MRNRVVSIVLSVIVLNAAVSPSINSVYVYADTDDRIEITSDDIYIDENVIELQQPDQDQTVVSDDAVLPEEISDVNAGDEVLSGEIRDVDAGDKESSEEIRDMNTDEEVLSGEKQGSDPVGSETGDETESAETEEKSYGYIRVDLPFEIPIVSGNRTTGNRRLLRSAPSSYSSRDRLPQIRNQNPYGMCWAFSTIGAAEADLIMDGKADKYVDLSEIHLAYYASHRYTDPKGCRSDVTEYRGSWLQNGGSPVQAYRLLSNLVGIADEVSAPYSDGNGYDPGSEHAFDLDRVQVKGAYLINGDDRNGIKEAIRNHGGAVTSYYDNDHWYGSTYNSYYCSDDDVYPNHAIILVGWDDSFSADKFEGTSKPDGDGAWLVRNSWGEQGDGHHGYFWLSYYDKGLVRAEETVAIDADTDMYDYCYAYDGSPANDTIVRVAPSQAVAVDFDVDGGETLAGIGFELGTANVTVSATVTNKDTGESVSGSLKTTYAGFYTLDMSGIDFTDDSEVEVLLKLAADNDDKVKLVTEYVGSSPMGNVNYTGVCDRGFRLGGTERNLDPRIKLYTDKKDIGVVVPVSVSLDKTSAEVTKGDGMQLTATVLPSDSNDKRVTWSSDNTSVAMVDSNGHVSAVSPGTAVITAKTVSGGRSAGCTVTVTWLDRQWSVVGGKSYWYENGVKQGVPGDKKNIWDKKYGKERGREIYDPGSDAWYWLDSVYDGAKAVGKEVWMPYIYQNEREWKDDETELCKNVDASDEGMRNQVRECIKNGNGKWVRYDGNGKMMKGWVTIKGKLAEIYPEQSGNVYYYDNKTGLMAKGKTVIKGRTYYFDEVTGELLR